MPKIDPRATLFATPVALEDRAFRACAAALGIQEKVRKLPAYSGVFYGIPLLDLYVARETARSGDGDGAIPVMRETVEDLLRARCVLTR